MTTDKEAKSCFWELDEASNKIYLSGNQIWDHHVCKGASLAPPVLYMYICK